MIRIRIQRGLRSCMFAMLLIMPVMAAGAIVGSVSHAFAGPVQEAWRRAFRNIGSGGCAKCDSPSSVQYAVVTVYENPNGQGKIQGYYRDGKYRADRAQLKTVGDKAISSLRVEPGYKVRLCQSAGTGDGASPCEDFSPGQHNVSDQMNDQTSFIWVWKG